MATGKDLGIIVGENEDGSLRMIRKDPEGGISCGDVRPAKNGKPLMGSSELISMDPTENLGEYEITQIYSPNPRPAGSKGTSSGPAQVATEAYRDNYDKIKWS